MKCDIVLIPNWNFNMLGCVHTQTNKSSIYPRSRSPLKSNPPQSLNAYVNLGVDPSQIPPTCCGGRPQISCQYYKRQFWDWHLRCVREHLVNYSILIPSTYGETIKESASSWRKNTYTYSTKLPADSYGHISECNVPRGSSSERGRKSAFLYRMHVYFTRMSYSAILLQGGRKIS